MKMKGNLKTNVPLLPMKTREHVANQIYFLPAAEIHTLHCSAFSVFVILK